MKIPRRIPGLKLLTILSGAYGAIWISLEGELWRAILISVGVALLSLGHFWQRALGGRSLSAGQWLTISASSGALLGFASGGLTLIFMSLKTGLHAHGPEFTSQELSWVIRQIPWWSAAGLVGGLGLGLLFQSAPDE